MTGGPFTLTYGVKVRSHDDEDDNDDDIAPCVCMAVAATACMPHSNQNNSENRNYTAHMNDRNLPPCTRSLALAQLSFATSFTIRLGCLAFQPCYIIHIASSVIIFLYHCNLYMVCNGSQIKSHRLWCMTIVPKPKLKQKKLMFYFEIPQLTKSFAAKPEKSVTRFFVVAFFLSLFSSGKTTAIYLPFLRSQNSN